MWAHRCLCVGAGAYAPGVPAQPGDVRDLHCTTWLQFSYAEFSMRLHFRLPPIPTGCGSRGPFLVQPRPHLSLWLWLSELLTRLARPQGLQLFLIPFALVPSVSPSPRPSWGSFCSLALTPALLSIALEF